MCAVIELLARIVKPLRSHCEAIFIVLWLAHNAQCNGYELCFKTFSLCNLTRQCDVIEFSRIFILYQVCLLLCNTLKVMQRCSYETISMWSQFARHLSFLAESEQLSERRENESEAISKWLQQKKAVAQCHCNAIAMALQKAIQWDALSYR